MVALLYVLKTRVARWTETTETYNLGSTLMSHALDRWVGVIRNQKKIMKICRHLKWMVPYGWSRGNFITLILATNQACYQCMDQVVAWKIFFSKLKKKNWLRNFFFKNCRINCTRLLPNHHYWTLVDKSHEPHKSQN